MTILDPNQPTLRPNVDMNVGDTYGPPPPDVTWGQFAEASFRQNNLIGSALYQKQGRDPLEREDGFDVWTYNKGTKYDTPDRKKLFVDYYNKEATDILRAQLDMEDVDRETLSRGSWLMEPLDMLISTLDPTILLPGGGILRGARGGYSAFRTAGTFGAGAAGAIAVQEVGLQATQASRPALQSAIAIGAGAVLGSALGAGVASFMSRNEFTRIASMIDKEMGEGGGRPLPIDINDKAVRSAIDEARGGSLSAAESIDSLDDLTVAGRGAGALMQLSDWARLNPMVRLFSSPDPVTRSIAENLIENAAYLRKNLDGKASAQAVETFIKEATQGMTREAIVVTNKIYDDLLKAGQHISQSDFKARVGRAMRRNDTDDSGGPIADAVSRAAKEWRNKVFDPLKDAATGKRDLYGNFKVNLLPEDIKVETAPSYFMRMYNTIKMTAQEGKFRDIAKTWAQSETDKAKAALTERRDRRVASLDQRIADLQLSGRARSQTMQQLAERLTLLRTTNPSLDKMQKDIAKLSRKAVKAAKEGDSAAEAAARAQIDELRSQGDVPLARYRAEERALYQRLNAIRMNIVGRGELIEQAKAKQLAIEEANVDTLFRLKTQLENLQEKLDRADPAEHEETLARIREELLETIQKSEEAADKIAKLEGRASDVEATDQLDPSSVRVMDDVAEQLWTLGFDQSTVSAYARYFAERYRARADRLGIDPWEAYQQTGARIRGEDAPMAGQLGEREFAQGDSFDQMFVNLSASTPTIGGLDALTKIAQGSGPRAKAAARLLNEIAYDSLSHLLGGTKAQIDYTPSAGLYFGDYEPSMGLDIRFTPEDRDAVLAGLAKFAQNFNQAEVHVREAGTGVSRGTPHPDGSMETLVYEWPLAKPLSRQAIQKVIDASGLPGLTFSDKGVTAYYAGKPNDEAAIRDFIAAAGRAGTAGLGEARAGSGRLSRFGDVDGAIPFERIAGELRPGPTDGASRTAQRTASRVAGFDVKPARGEPTITTEKRALQQRIAAAYERMPLNDLANPVVRRAYVALAEEVKKQYDALPIKVEIYKGDGEPYSAPRASDAMRADVADNNHLYIFGTNEKTFGPEGVVYDNHPLLADSGLVDMNGEKMLYNDLLRAVHDYYAHTMAPNSFGPIGEEAAWLNHMRMIPDPWARWALTSETRGQNSWVNFRPGAEKMTQPQRGFAEQKVALLPLEFVRTGDETLDRQIDDVIRRIPSQAMKYATPEAVKEAAAPRMRELIDTVAGFKAVARYLSPDEEIKLREKQAKKMVDIFEGLPDPEEMAAVAFSGRAKRGWYDRSARALVEIFGAEDAPRFAALLAALSPQTSVQSNAINALKVWTAWKKSNARDDRDAILRIVGQNVEGGTEASILDAWKNNTVRALTHSDPGGPEFSLSGPKVHSFMSNLLGRVNEVTNDAWMANFSNINQQVFRKTGPAPGKGAGYMAMTAAVRRAAELLTKRTGHKWTPAEIQETIWSWAKTLFEKRESFATDRTLRTIGHVEGGPDDRTMFDILKAGGLTHADIANTPDFEQLFVSGVYRRILEEGGYGEGIARAEAGSEGLLRGGDDLTSVTAAEGSGISQSAFDRHLRRAAGRLEQLRADRIAAEQDGAAGRGDPFAEGGADDAPITTREKLEAERDRLVNEPDTEANRARLEEIEKRLDVLLDEDGFDLMQSAYHSSPHRFDRFSLEKVGTGEGAQTYGWGLYYAENKAVAREYRNALGEDDPGYMALVRKTAAELQGDVVLARTLRSYADDSGLSVNMAARRVASSLRAMDEPRPNQLVTDQPVEKIEAAIKRLRDYGPPGRTYEVDLPDENWLLWDKKLSQQPEIEAKVRAAFGPEAGGVPDPTGEQLYKWLVPPHGEDGQNPQKMASIALRDAGIVGHKYLDSGSRIGGIAARIVEKQGSIEAALEVAKLRYKNSSKMDDLTYWQDAIDELTKPQTYNFVLFDDNRVAIKNFFQGGAEGGNLGQAGDRGMISFRGERPIINLFKNRDLSTLLHESGHLWLEELKVDSALPNAPQQLRDDMQTVLDWMGVKEGQSITREQHEKFARAMEAYLRKGQAPSNALAAVFQTFKEWLTNIYKSITELNAPVSKELKGVLDRLLATDKQIANRGVSPEALTKRAEREKAVDANRQERIDGLGQRMEQLDDMDPEQQIAELNVLLEERIRRAAKTVERGGQRIAELSERIDSLDPEIARKQLSDMQARKDEVTSDYHQRVNVDMGEGYVDDIVDSVWNQITGRSATSVPMNIVATTRGPLKDRTWNIPDHLIEDFLEDDIEMVGRRYARIMAAETELAAKFGSPDMKDQIKAIHESYKKVREAIDLSPTRRAELQSVLNDPNVPANRKDAVRKIIERVDSKTPRDREKMLKRLNARERADIRDIEAMRDVLRGTYMGVENTQNWARVVHGAKTFNYIRSMGGVTLASLTDAARPMMVHGLGRYLTDGIGPMLRGLKGIRLSRAEAELAGAVGETEMLHRTAAMADLTDPYSRGHPVEKLFEALTNGFEMGNRRIPGFSKATLLPQWTDWGKSVASRMTMNRVLKNVHRDYAALKPKERAYMNYLGIDEGQAAAIKAEYDAHGELVDGLLIPNTDQWTDTQARRTLRAALNKDVDSIIVTPGAGDIPLLARHPLGGALLQFKSFALASNQRVLMRGLQEGPTKLLAGIVGMASIGMAITWLKHYESNRQDQLSDNPGYWIAEGLDRSGIFALLFEASNTVEKWGGPGIKTGATQLFPQASQKGPGSRYASRSDIATVLGPTADMGDTLIRLLRGLGDGDMTEGDVNSLRRLLPFSTLPGIRSLLEYGVLPPIKEAVR